MELEQNFKNLFEEYDKCGYTHYSKIQGNKLRHYLEQRFQRFEIEFKQIQELEQKLIENEENKKKLTEELTKLKVFWNGQIGYFRSQMNQKLKQTKNDGIKRQAKTIQTKAKDFLSLDGNLNNKISQIEREIQIYKKLII